MTLVQEKIAECFDGLRASEFPPGFVSGGPRTDDITIYHWLPIPEVDGGGVDVLDSLEALAVEQLPVFVSNPETFNIASAFVAQGIDAPKDAYEYRMTFSVNL